MDPIDVARSILGGLLADAATVERSSQATAAWLDGHVAEVGPHGVAWAASHAVQTGLDQLDAGATAIPSPAQVQAFRDLPVAARVVVALHEFCRFDDVAIAAATARPVDEVEQLLDAIDPPDEPTPPPFAPAAAAPVAATVPAPPPRRSVDPFPNAVGPGAPSVRRPPSSSSSSSRRRRRRRRSGPRWWVVATAVVLGLIATGIVFSNLREDDPGEPRRAGAAGLADPTTVSRDQISKGCATADGDAELAPQNVDVDIDGEARRYRIVAPAALEPGQPRPLLVDFGDLGQSVDDHVAESRFDQLATALKFIVVTVGPANGREQWNVNGDPGDADDAALVERIIADQAERLCVDRTRIVLAGRGAGAHFAATYACDHPGDIDALVLVAGVYRPDDCETEGRLSVLALLGTKDAVFPITGGTGADYAAALDAAGGKRPGSDYEPGDPTDALDDITRSLDCVGKATQRIGLLLVRIATSCADDGEVWRGVIDGAGHEWFPSTYDVVVQFLGFGPLQTA